MFNLPADDLWRDRNYRRLWLSILISSFGGHITALALALFVWRLSHIRRITTLPSCQHRLFSAAGGDGHGECERQGIADTKHECFHARINSKSNDLGGDK